MKKLDILAIRAAYTGKILFTGLLLALSTPSLAHTVWLEPLGDTKGSYQVLFGGHAGKLETLEYDKLKSVIAIDNDGNTSALVVNEQAHLQVPANTTLVSIHYDNGFWSRDAMGQSINKPMNEVSGADSATLALKYHKTIVNWNARTNQAIGQPFEVVPLNKEQPVAGQPVKLQVLVDGQPAAGIALGHGEEGNIATTNNDGIAEFTPSSGFNRVWAGQRLPVNAATHTELSYEYLLGFEALPAQ
ncbi:MAG: DUF4198 domain-containing protein [Parahaliea sp.]